MGPPERKTPREYSMQEIIEHQHHAAVAALTDIAALPDLSLALQRRLWAVDKYLCHLSFDEQSGLTPGLARRDGPQPNCVFVGGRPVYHATRPKYLD